MRHGRGEDYPGARDHLDGARRHEVRLCRLPPHHMREFHYIWPVRMHTKQKRKRVLIFEIDMDPAGALRVEAPRLIATGHPLHAEPRLELD